MGRPHRKKDVLRHFSLQWKLNQDMMKEKKTQNRLLNTLQVFSLIPFVMIFILPRDFNAWWWNLFVLIAFLSGFLFCAFVNDNYWSEKQKYFRHRIKFFGKEFILYNLSAIIIAPVPVLFLIEYTSVLSTANIIAVIIALIVLFKIFKIEIADISAKDR